MFITPENRWIFLFGCKNSRFSGVINWPLKSSKMYENLTVGQATTHFSLIKTVCWYHSSFKNYRQKRPILLRPEIVYFSRPPAFYPYTFTCPNSKFLFFFKYCFPIFCYGAVQISSKDFGEPNYGLINSFYAFFSIVYA